MITRRKVLAGCSAAVLVGKQRLVWGQVGKVRRVALTQLSLPVERMTEEANYSRYIEFYRELRVLGWRLGEDLIVEPWSARGREGEYLDFAKQVVNSKPDVIVAGGARLAGVFREATSTTPVVTVGTFPTEWGLVAGLAHPGGNMTGFDLTAGGQLYFKHMQLLHDTIPGLSRVAWLGPVDFWEGPFGDWNRKGADQLGFALVPIFVDSPVAETSIQRAFVGMAVEQFDALYIAPTGAFTAHAQFIAGLAASTGLPSLTSRREYAAAGVLLANWVDMPGLYRSAAGYVDRILRGERPGDLPVQNPTAFDLIINLRTARALGIEIPPKLLIQATELIE